MLTQEDAIEAVCAFLMEDGFEIEERSARRRSNIIGRKGAGRIFVGVRGNANKKGELFKSDQPEKHVAQKLYDALQRNDSKNKEDTIALAFPDDHRESLNAIRFSLGRLGLRVLLIDHGGNVSEPFSRSAET